MTHEEGREMEHQLGRRIPSGWWAQVLNGDLYRVTSDMFPFLTSTLTARPFVLAYRYQCKAWGLRASCRFRDQTRKEDRDWEVFVQAIHNKKPGSTFYQRSDLSLAKNAPVVPRKSPLTVVMRPDHDDLMAEITRAQTIGPNAAPAQLRGHPSLHWVADFCDCETVNFRTHARTCPVYAAYPMLKFHLDKAPMSPEEWVQKYYAP